MMHCSNHRGRSAVQPPQDAPPYRHGLGKAIRNFFVGRLEQEKTERIRSLASKLFAAFLGNSGEVFL